MLFTKLLANRLFLLFISLIVTGIIGTLMVHKLELMFSELSHETLAQLKEDEEGIAILLVGFGVLLEGRNFYKTG